MRSAALLLLLVLVYVQAAAADDVTERIRHNCKTLYPAKPCGDGWFRIDVYRCAKYFWTPRTFRDADNDCRRQRGHLVSMHNAVEYSQVLCLAFRANKRKDHFWIGGRSKYLWHSFQWTDKTPFEFQRWAFFQPDREPGEECVEMNYETWGYWNNAVCSGKKYYVCARRM
ncbi:neurocan core protein-like [Toxotes jaculatrix]|uniref:neurocan core protein-like n=1 Tax=Toxotes jaculatrix TaxID=941984 RepID=UPI001B3AFCA4|nr:neurocan core protein-like [Toxotes jaculatrix]XP_040919126.1 neurocan core protein-like [Toxotes jaculatrix]